MFICEDYKDIFERRGKEYNYAMEVCPNARDDEFLNAVRLMAVYENTTVCDIPSGGGYLQRYLPNDFNLICAEESDYFYSVCPISERHRKIKFNLKESIPLKDKCVDIVVSIAGLHHLAYKAPMFAEMHRILRKGGQLIIADVSEGSKIDHWLNDFVHSNNSFGHEGVFLKDSDEIFLKENLKFKLELCKEISFYWQFMNKDDMVQFCKNLFGIDKCSDEKILNGIDRYLGFKKIHDKIYMNWSLKYINAIKR